jgi:hypothetical protein
MWTTNISKALIIAVVSAIPRTLQGILFSSMVWGTCPSLYLQVCIINMLLYFQPLSVTNENFPLKRVPLIASNLPHHFYFYFYFYFKYLLYPYYVFYTKQYVLPYFIIFIIINNHVIVVLYTLVLMSPLNPNKYDDFHIHVDYVILYGFTEGK